MATLIMPNQFTCASCKVEFDTTDMHLPEDVELTQSDLDKMFSASHEHLAVICDECLEFMDRLMQSTEALH